MNAMNLPEIEIARFNMVEQQIKPWDVSDPKVTDALFAVHRELYTPSSTRALAFSDLEIPLIMPAGDTHQTMLTPKMEARLAQALGLKPDDCVLEIGTGSGYQAALLAYMTRQITTVEIDARLVTFAQDNLRQNQVNNVTVEHGDGCKGWGTNEYDAILVTGSLPAVPDAMKYQLRIGGRLVVVLGQAPIMTAIKITRTTAASFETQSLFETVIKPLVGPHVSQFKF
jgi:protein-L-isoaspartate(D-aspartate) O-methyltransferase